MKKVGQIEGFVNELSLSCVEDYLLFALKNEGNNFSWLFYQSMISFRDILMKIVSGTTNYAYFDGIERLHKTASKMGVLDINYQEVKEITEIPLSIEKKHTLIQITPQFMLKHFNMKLLRDDHFLLIEKKNEEEFYWINGRPQAYGEIKASDLKLNFANVIFQFQICDEWGRKISNCKTKLMKEFLRCTNCAFENKVIRNEVVGQVEQLRDTIGILKVSRKRAYYFCENFMNVEFMETYLGTLEFWYAKLTYLSIRNEYEAEIGREMIRVIEEEEQKVLHKIILEMERGKIR